MTAVAGQFVKFDAVATRKVVRLTIEAPIEKADEILRDLGGYPDPANAKWVGIAPLTGQPTENTLKGGAFAQAAAMLCDNTDFQSFARRWGYKDPVRFIYAHCDITTRAHLDHDVEAAKSFQYLQQEFDAWRNKRDNETNILAAL